MLSRCSRGLSTRGEWARIPRASWKIQRKWPRSQRGVCVARAGPSGSTASAQAIDEDEDDEAGKVPLYLDEDQMYQHDCNLPEPPGGIWGQYTPNDYITFSDDENAFCEHSFNIRVKATPAKCVEFLNKWSNLINCFDLIDTIAEDQLEEDCAVVQVFYKWLKMPPMQILMAIRKFPDQDEAITFVSEGGCPFAAQFSFTPDPEDPEYTAVECAVGHATPVLMVEWVGVPAFHQHVGSILRENLEVFRLLLEGELTADGLEAYYKEHRTDFYDGPNTDGNLDWLPDDKLLWVEETTPPERELEAEEYAMSLVAMEEAVAEGHYVETEQGWASTLLTTEQRIACDELARRYRYDALKEQNANIDDVSAPIDVEPFNRAVQDLLVHMTTDIREEAEGKGASPLEGDGDEVDEVTGEIVRADKGGDDKDGRSDYMVGYFGVSDDEDEENEGEEREDDDDEEEGVSAAADDEEEDDEDEEIDESSQQWTAKNYLIEDDDENPDPSRAIELPSLKEAATMSEADEDEFMAILAEGLGLPKEQWAKYSEASKIDSKYMEDLSRAFAASTEDGMQQARAQGLDYEEWMTERVDELEEAGTEALQTLADEANMTLPEYVDQLLEFSSEMESAAVETGRSEDEVMAAFNLAIDKTEQELTEMALKLRIPIPQVLAIQEQFEREADEHADELGLTRDEYVDHKFEAMLAGVDLARQADAESGEPAAAEAEAQPETDDRSESQGSPEDPPADQGLV